jgi:acyl carrier protein
MSDEMAIYAALEVIFRRILMNDDVVLTPETAARDLEGWDSFRQIEIILSVQEEFNIRLSSEEVDALDCAGDLVRLIAGKVAAYEP